MSKCEMKLLQSTVDVLILRTFSKGPMHGFGLSKWIRDRTEGVLGTKDAALYQALHRIERKGWIDAERGLADNNRRANLESHDPATLTQGGRAGSRIPPSIPGFLFGSHRCGRRHRPWCRTAHREYYDRSPPIY